MGKKKSRYKNNMSNGTMCNMNCSEELLLYKGNFFYVGIIRSTCRKVMVSIPTLITLSLMDHHSLDG